MYQTMSFCLKSVGGLRLTITPTVDQVNETSSRWVWSSWGVLSLCGRPTQDVEMQVPPSWQMHNVCCHLSSARGIDIRDCCGLRKNPSSSLPNLQPSERIR